MNQETDTKDNFLYKTINITEWMKDEITYFVNQEGYIIANFDGIYSELMTRMGKISVMSTIDLKMVDQKGHDYHLENYSSSNTKYDNVELKWLVDFIKEKEVEALLKFGGKALGTESNDSIKETKPIEFVSSGKKTHGDSDFTISFNGKIKDLIDFLSKQEHQVLWAGTTSQANGKSLKLDNVTMEDISTGVHSISLKYKWNDWQDFSDVKIDFTQFGDTAEAKVHLRQVPIELVDNVINQWKIMIFYPISIMFRCPLVNP